MKKRSFFNGLCLTAIVTGMLASCGSNKKQEEAAADENLQAIEEMVQVVEKPAPANDMNRYNAAFFENDANKGATATDSTYAQTPTGLKYVIAKEGSGKQPSASSEVTVHYVGTLTNGEQFDSSVDRGEPASFPLEMVIPGWTEGLQLMQEGGTAVFYIPADLAYGDRDLPGIPANSPLIFWVQLLQVN